VSVCVFSGYCETEWLTADCQCTQQCIDCRCLGRQHVTVFTNCERTDGARLNEYRLLTSGAVRLPSNPSMCHIIHWSCCCPCTFVSLRHMLPTYVVTGQAVSFSIKKLGTFGPVQQPRTAPSLASTSPIAQANLAFFPQWDEKWVVL